MTDEVSLWTRMRVACIEAAGGGRWERVENGIVDGMPDVNFCVKGVEGWVELKVARELPGPRTERKGVFTYNRGLSLSQVNWHLKQQSVGGRSFVFAFVVANGYYLWHGNDVERFNAATLEELGAGAIWFGKKMDEQMVRQLTL